MINRELKKQINDEIAQIDIEIAACEQAIRNAYAIRDVEALSKRVQSLSKKRKETVL